MRYVSQRPRFEKGWLYEQAISQAERRYTGTARTAKEYLDVRDSIKGCVCVCNSGSWLKRVVDSRVRHISCGVRYRHSRRRAGSLPGCRDSRRRKTEPHSHRISYGLRPGGCGVGRVVVLVVITSGYRTRLWGPSATEASTSRWVPCGVPHFHASR